MRKAARKTDMGKSLRSINAQIRYGNFKVGNDEDAPSSPSPIPECDFDDDSSSSSSNSSTEHPPIEQPSVISQASFSNLEKAKISPSQMEEKVSERSEPSLLEDENTRDEVREMFFTPTHIHY